MPTGYIDRRAFYIVYFVSPLGLFVLYVEIKRELNKQNIIKINY